MIDLFLQALVITLGILAGVWIILFPMLIIATRLGKRTESDQEVADRAHAAAMEAMERYHNDPDNPIRYR